MQRIISSAMALGLLIVGLCFLYLERFAGPAAASNNLMLGAFSVVIGAAGLLSTSFFISAQPSRRVTPFNPPPNQGYAERRSCPHSVGGQKHAYVLTTFRGLPGSGKRVRARRHETGPRLARISGARPLSNAGRIYERAEHEHRRQATETIQSVPKLAVDGHDLFHRSSCYLAAGVRQLGR